MNVKEYYLTSLRQPRKLVLLATARDDPSRLMGWSSSGDRVVLSIGGEVRIYDLATGSYKAIGAGIHPSWSPDGRWIAWKNLKTGGTRLDLKTGDKVEIMPGETISYGFQWSPDSQWLMGCWERLHMFGNTTIFVHRITDGENANILDVVNGMTNREFAWVVADPDVTLREA